MVRSPIPCIHGHVLSIVGKLFARRGAWALFHGIGTYGLKDIEFQNLLMN